MLAEAKRVRRPHCAYGRKINSAEDQLSFIRYLRAVADEELEAEEAVRAYHGALAKLRIEPHRSLEEDLKQTPTAARLREKAFDPTTSHRSKFAAKPPPKNNHR